MSHGSLEALSGGGAGFRPSGVLPAHEGLGTCQGHSYLCPFTLLPSLQASPPPLGGSAEVSSRG